jgi:hypothetical protein
MIEGRTTETGIPSAAASSATRSPMALVSV